jgi:hypothetical protein
MEILTDLNTVPMVGTQPGANPCPTCTIVPDPPVNTSLETLSVAQGYALLVSIDSNWYAPASNGSIESAAFVLTCDALDNPLSFDISDDIPRPSGSGKLTLGPIEDLESLEGCTASVDFTVKLDGQVRSAQSPVYVDP